MSKAPTPAATPQIDAFVRSLEEDANPSTDDEAFWELASLFGARDDAALLELDFEEATGRIFAAAVLRAIAARPGLLDSVKAAYRVVNVVKDHTNQDFWNAVGQDPKKNETVQRRIAGLRDAIGPALQGFFRLGDVADSGSADDLSSSLMKTMNHPIVRAAIGPFVRWSVLKDRYRQLLLYASDVKTCLDVHAFEAFRLGAQGMREDLGDLHTSPAELLASVLEITEHRLRSLIDESDRAKPASIELGPALRRLPLDLPGQRFRLPIRVANHGPGIAFSPRLEILACSQISLLTHVVSLGDELPPGVVVIEFEGEVDADTGDRSEPAEVLLQIEWKSMTGVPEVFEVSIAVDAQTAGVDWDSLERSQPYSLDAVSDRSALFGRAKPLRQLVTMLTGSPIGSAFIYGQKRVGKTSLAQTALSEVRRSSHMTCIWLDAGGVNNSEPGPAVDTLVRRLIKDLQQQRPALRAVSAVEANGSLAPLCEFVDDCLLVEPQLRLVIAIDEFDQLPVPLLRRTPVSDAFFTGLRSLTTSPNVGLVLIGGERMKLILSGQGVQLNKFQPFQVDYIDRSTNWSDFIALVRQPVAGALEFDDEAIDEIYEATAGNPYFAKLVLRRVHESCLERRVAWVIRDDVAEAIARLTTSSGDDGLVASSFSHYWEDYLLERGDVADAITLRRRRLLLALSEAVRLSGNPDGAVFEREVLKASARRDVPPDEAKIELEQFSQRQILQMESDRWSARLPLFHRWLVTRGPAEIAMTTAELASEQSVAEANERLRVTYDEAAKWSEQIGAFRGKHISADRTLDYIRQFGEIADQRRIFELLKRLHFISTSDVHACLRQAFEILQARLKQHAGTWSRRDILITYTDGPGKSQQAIGREFAHAAAVPVNINVVDDDRLHRRLADHLDAVVVADDFVGTGKSLTAGIAGLVSRHPRLRDSNCLVAVFAVAGFDAGCRAVEKSLTDLFGSRALFYCVHRLSDRDRAFSPAAFDDEFELGATEMIVRRFGERLDKRNPTGYGDCQALVVFDRTTPNCSLPILWRDASGQQSFRSLFPRR